MNVLVLGGAGYIGSHVAHLLQERGYSVIVYDDFSRGHREAVAGLNWMEGDIGDEARLYQLIVDKQIEAIFHFAAASIVRESVEDPQHYFHTNVEKGLRLLAATKRAKVPFFIFSSTAAVYGDPRELPITENHRRLPKNPYGISKAFFEDILRCYHEAYGIGYVALRYFNAAGADPKGVLGEDHEPETHLIPLILRSILEQQPLVIYGHDYPTADCTAIRDYIHVSDLAQAHILALEYLIEGGRSQAMNLGSDRGSSVLDVIKTAEKITGYPVPYEFGPRRPGDPATLVAGSQRAKELLGWQPLSSDLESIIQTAWNWHRRHPRGYKKK